MKKFILVLVVLCLVCPPAHARKIGGAKIPNNVDADGTKLLLNGAGLRKKFGFAKVYAGALYLKAKSTDAVKIREADEPMAIVMVWIRDGVEREKILEQFDNSYKNVTNDNVAPLKDRIKRFYACFPEVCNGKDVYEMLYIPGTGTRVTINGQLKETIEGLDFKQATFGIWLPDTPLESAMVKLKDDMLGDW